MHPLMDGHPHRCSTDFEQTDTTGWTFGTAGCWVSVIVSTSPSGYVAAFGEAGVPTLGLEGGVGCSPRVTFDGKVRNLGPRTFCLRPQNFKFDSPLPEDHRVNIL